MRNSKGQFIKGNIPWHKGTTGLKASTSGSFKKGNRYSINTEFKKDTKEELSINWKGDKVGYHGVHIWIRKKLGKPIKCSHCGKISLIARMIQWANISGKYKRDIKDWKQLCTVCHRQFDGFTKLNKKQVIEIKERNSRGESQRSLAKEFGVNQMTISRMIRNKTKSYV